MIEELYDLIHEKLCDNFNIDEDSSNYIKYDGSLTLRINNAEFYAEFGKYPGILICEDVTKRLDEIYVDLDLVDGDWMMTSYSKKNLIKHQYTPYTEKVLDDVIKDFKLISGYKETSLINKELN